MVDMTPARKRMALLIIVVGSALIGERVVALVEGEATVVEPTTKLSGRARTERRYPSSDPREPSLARVQTDLLDRHRQTLSGEADSDGVANAMVFDAVSWQPPALKADSPPPPTPKPVAPPFPYAYLGGLSEDGVRTTFFNQGDRVLPVKVGDTIDAVYRVEQMNEKNMTLTYLPLDQSLTVHFRRGG